MNQVALRIAANANAKAWAEVFTALEAAKSAGDLEAAEQTKLALIAINSAKKHIIASVHANRQKRTSECQDKP
jgi:hypothetical protein